MPTTQFERSPNSISSYSVNSGLTEWIKAVLNERQNEVSIIDLLTYRCLIQVLSGPDYGWRRS